MLSRRALLIEQVYQIAERRREPTQATLMFADEKQLSLNFNLPKKPSTSTQPSLTKTEDRSA
jgi:hypothetical protein